MGLSGSDGIAPIATELKLLQVRFINSHNFIKVYKYNIIESISHQCCHDNKEEAKKMYQESLNLLKDRTGREGQGVLQDLLGTLTKV